MLVRRVIHPRPGGANGSILCSRRGRSSRFTAPVRRYARLLPPASEPRFSWPTRSPPVRGSTARLVIGASPARGGPRLRDCHRPDRSAWAA